MPPSLLGLFTPLVSVPLFPLTNPVFIFAAVLAIMFVAPIVLNRLRVPSIIGLIVAGVVVGPKGLGILEQQGALELLGKVGLLYLMFLAGLEMDLRGFLRRSSRSVLFGATTFVIPFVVGLPIIHYGLGLSGLGLVLLASMFSTHTLLAYPIVSRLGLTRIEAVTVTIGGTIITDTVVLLLLTVLASFARGSMGWGFALQLGAGLAALGFVVAVVIPRLSRWFLRRLAGESSAQYVFILLVVFGVSSLAQLAGIEPIVGAFLAGLVLNPLIPHTSPLMNRILFIGNTVFIPFFLIGVGMIVDLRVVLNGTETLWAAALLTATAMSTKWLAAWVTQLALRYSKNERRLIFGLSNAHAAATLAVTLTGFQLGVLSAPIINGTIILILLAGVVSTFVTENAAKAILEEGITDTSDLENNTDTDDEGLANAEKLLVPIANPRTVGQLLDFALLIKAKASNAPLYALSVVPDDDQAETQMRLYEKEFQAATLAAAATESSIQIVSRIDFNVADGIARAAKELLTTKTVMGWNGETNATNFLFGTVLERLLSLISRMVVVVKARNAIQPRHIAAVVPDNAHLERGFVEWVTMLQNLAENLSVELHLYTTDASDTHTQALREAFGRKRNATPPIFKTWQATTHLDTLAHTLHPADDLVVIIASRVGGISDTARFNVFTELSRQFRAFNCVIIYPYQTPFQSTTLGAIERIDAF